jgi:hypothetical protein
MFDQGRNHHTPQVYNKTNTTRKSIFFDENHVWLLTAQAVYNLVTALSVIKCSKVVTKLKKQYNFEANPSQT